MVRRLSNNTRAPNATGASLVVVVVVVVTLAASASGCSFLFSEGAPDNYKTRASFTCGASYAPPIADTIATGVIALTAASIASSKESTIATYRTADQPMERHTLNVAIGVETAIAIGTAAGAVYGYHAAHDCREATQERTLEVARAQLLPYPYGVPPYGAPPVYWPPPIYSRVPAAPDAPPPVAAPAPAAPATPSP